MQGEYRRAHEMKLSTDALYESELAATHQAWELVVELKKNKLIAKQQSKLCTCLSCIMMACARSECMFVLVALNVTWPST